MQNIIKDIQDNHLFDADWYISKYPDVKMLSMTPIEHYIKIGRKLGRKPTGDAVTKLHLKAFTDESHTEPLIKSERSTIIGAMDISTCRNTHNKEFSFDIDHSQETKRPLLSIVMPVFNVGPYLDASILSILNQGFSDFELIIVNDASTDNSKKIIEMYASQDSRIKVINLDYNTLGGAGIPSNLGIKAAKGKYIGFVDSDDFITQNAFGELIKQAEKHSAEVVIGDFCTFHEDDRTVSKSYDSGNWNNIPTDTVICANSHPQIFRISPVPWRKLYNSKWVKENNIMFPEGDYFYEDNPLHWLALSRSKRTVFSRKVISYHRMAREGQTMGASTYKLSAMCSHLNTIANKIIYHSENINESFSNEFFDYWYRCDWVAEKQSDERIAALIRKQMGNIYERCSTKIKPISDRSNFHKRVEHCKAAYEDIDLTIVIPAFNSEDFIEETINSVLAINKININVLVINDGSTDRTLEIIKEIEKKDKRVFVFNQNNRGAGRSRNSLIPLCTGEYTYFLDADDYINPEALTRVVIAAKKRAHDLMFFKYRIEFYDKKTTRGMFNADNDLWSHLNASKGHNERQVITAKLINYPWNRIVSTKLLLDENIFFGASPVHNDIPFHWHTISAAKYIGHVNEEVCIHRKFETRSQITNISDSRRMMVFSALDYTNNKIRQYQFFEKINSTWKVFSKDLLQWASARIPEELSKEFAEKEKNYLNIIQGNK